MGLRASEETREVQAQEKEVAPREHVKQREFLQDRTRFKFLLAGRRGGKTTGIVEDLLSWCPTAPDNAELVYIGPTHMHAKELVWDALCDRLYDMGWKHRPLVSYQAIELTRGRKILIIGAEKIQRIRGHKLWRAYLDEVAFYSVPLRDIWRAIRPALSDFRGGGVVSTTPNGKGTDAYDFYLETLKKKSWRYFHWTTLDNPGISTEEIDEARAELDERSFKQEYEATWESFEGLAYYNFDESLHIKPCADFERAPYFITLDFNVNPTSLLVGQLTTRFDHALPVVKIRKEYSLRNSSTVETVKKFCADFAFINSIECHVHGDATGDARRSNTGRSDYYYVEEVLKQHGFNYRLKVPASNPPIVDRVAHMNGWLKNVYGVSRIEIDPGCTDLLRDLSSQQLDGREPSSANNLGHKGDALGYYIYYQHLIGQRQPQRMIQL